VIKVNPNNNQKMAMLPILLEMVDEMYDSLDKQPNKGANFPFLYLPQTTRGACPRRQGGRCAARNGCNFRKCAETAKCAKPSSDDFQVSLNVKPFNSEEISVKVKGQEVIIEGKHEEREDEHGFVSRQFTRRYVLPEGYDMETVATTLDTDGKMTIKAHKPKPAVEGPQERIIPIERVASVVEPSAPVENGETEKKKEAEYTLEDAVE
jgi:HSP20 family molecular chaperone IbpA